MQRIAPLLVLTLSLGCSRATDPKPKAVADGPPDASARADAGMETTAKPTPPPPASPLAVIARAPMTFMATNRDATEIAMTLPHVQRRPGGGVFVASEYARAWADDAASPLTVVVEGRGFERDAALRPGEIQGAQGLRWIWADANGAVVSSEEATMRSGPRVSTYKLGEAGYKLWKDDIGYWNAIAARGAVLALERVAWQVPNSSMYPKGSEYYQDNWQLKPARIAVLSGSTPAPVMPAAVCAHAMSAAADGTIAVVVDRCQVAGSDVGVVRFAPGSTSGKLEWPSGLHRTFKDEASAVTVAAAGAAAIVASDGDRLVAWDGKAWTAVEAPGARILSLSFAEDGALWAVVDGKLMRRPSGAGWREVPLPAPPGDELEEHPYGAPEPSRPFFLRDGANEFEVLRTSRTAPMKARTVDATSEPALVLAHVDREAFVLSTRPRPAAARLPSIPTQRAQIVQRARPALWTPRSRYCDPTFLIYPEGTTAEAVRAKTALPAAGQGDDPKARIGEAIVEGKKTLIVFGAEEPVVEASKKSAALAPKRACAAPVVEREL